MPMPQERVLKALTIGTDYPLTDMIESAGDFAVDLAHELDRQGLTEKAGREGGDELLLEIITRALETHYAVEREQENTDA